MGWNTQYFRQTRMMILWVCRNSVSKAMYRCFTRSSSRLSVDEKSSMRMMLSCPMFPVLKHVRHHQPNQHWLYTFISRKISPKYFVSVSTIKFYGRNNRNIETSPHDVPSISPSVSKNSSSSGGPSGLPTWHNKGMSGWKSNRLCLQPAK